MKHPFTVMSVCISVFLSAAEPLYLAPAARCDMLSDCKHRLNGRLTRIALHYDAKNFHLLAECTARPGQPIQSKGSQADDPAIFSGDHIELMLTPHPDVPNPVYFHIVTNPGGLMYTARCRDVSWNPAGIAAVAGIAENGQSWKLHLTVPFAALNEKTPARGDRWRILVGRDADSICMARDYHDIRSHLPLIFAPPPQPPVCLNQVRLSDEKVCVFDFDTQNLPPQVHATIRSGSEILAEQKLTITGKHLLCSARIGNCLPLKNLYPVAVRLTDTKGRTLYQRQGVLQIGCGKTVELDAFYLLPGKELGYRQNLGKDVTWKVFSGSAVLAEGKAAPQGKISLPGNLSGRAVVRFDSPDGHTSRTIDLLPSIPSAVKIPAGALTVSSDRKLLRGGKPVYLLGLSFFRQSFYPFPPEFNFSSGGDGLAENGSKVRNLPFGSYQRLPFSARRCAPFEKHRAALDRFLNGCTVGDHLHRICYEANIPLAIPDENGNMVPLDSAPYMAQIYRHCKKMRPGLLFSIQIDNPMRIPDYCNSCDVLELACGSSSYGEYMIPSLKADLECVLRSLPGGKPVIYWLGGTIPNPRCRTAEELRAAIYICMLSGISGNIIHMGHTAMAPERRRFWSLLSGISREINAIYPLWAQGRKLPGFLRSTSDDGFVWQAAACAGETLLIVVNTDDVEKNFAVVTSSGKKFYASFTPYEVRVFRFPEEKSLD